MNLKEFQRIFSKILLEPEGRKALESEESWKLFLKKNNTNEMEEIPREVFSIYQNLMQNSLHETISKIFPYSKIILQQEWEELVEDFQSHYSQPSFQLYKSAMKFPQFLAEKKKINKKYPFIVDLALYEWIEVEVLNLPDVFYSGDLLKRIPESAEEFVETAPLWNFASEKITLNYPISDLIEAINIAIEQKGSEKEIERIEIPKKHTTYIVFKDDINFKAGYLKVNDLILKLISFSSPNITYYEIVETLWQRDPHLRHLPLNPMIESSRKLFETCFNSGLLLGSIPVSI